jgi:hypothetical protein
MMVCTVSISEGNSSGSLEFSLTIPFDSFKLDDPNNNDDAADDDDVIDEVAMEKDGIDDDRVDNDDDDDDDDDNDGDDATKWAHDNATESSDNRTELGTPIGMAMPRDWGC